tara:strand:+ start:491 stop:1489 length:999 start_codon:yes stop_codon:yes gene_type:complete
MILKSFDIDKSNISEFKLFIIYGENDGLKKEIIQKIKKKHSGKEIKYEEEQILKNKDNFFSELKNKSLFEDKKILYVDRCTEKISEIILELDKNYLDDLLIINCGSLEKKSKIRNLIEKSDFGIIIPTYKDNAQSLINIAKNFFLDKKISVSHETLNLLVNRSNGDRGYLKNELEKISNYSFDKKVISLREISTLTNLSENYSAAELVDASLTKNIKKTCEILKENNYSQEDTFFIIRVFLQKTKKILNLLEKIENENDIEKVMSEHRPPIFWKDKPMIKKQLKLWSHKKINELICKLNDIEIKIKRNNTLNLILMKNFIYEVLDQQTNSSS